MKVGGLLLGSLESLPRPCKQLTACHASARPCFTPSSITLSLNSSMN